MASASLKRSRTAGSTKTKFTLSMWFKRSSTDAKYLISNHIEQLIYFITKTYVLIFY